MRPIPKLECLRNDVHAAHDDSRAHVQRRAEHRELLRDLERELARRREDEREDAVRVERELLQDRQRERDCLAGPRLRVPDAVPALGRACVSSVLRTR